MREDHDFPLPLRGRGIEGVRSVCAHVRVIILPSPKTERPICSRPFGRADGPCQSFDAKERIVIAVSSSGPLPTS